MSSELIHCRVFSQETTGAVLAYSSSITTTYGHRCLTRERREVLLTLALHHSERRIKFGFTLSSLEGTSCAYAYSPYKEKSFPHAHTSSYIYVSGTSVSWRALSIQIHHNVAVLTLYSIEMHQKTSLWGAH